jgi:hypothetical protein
MLNLVVHKVNTRSQKTEKQNMLIYHDPDKFLFHKLEFFLGAHSQRDVPIKNTYFVYYLAYSEFIETVRNVVYYRYATDIHSSIISSRVGNEN